MRMRVGLLAIVIAVWALGPAPAWAAKEKPVTVTKDGSLRLGASDEDRRICLTFTEGASVSGESCAESADSGVVILAGRDARSFAVGVVVPAAATTVEVRRGGVLLATAATVAGEAYRGIRAGGVRFALVRLPRGARDDGLRVRALDTAGVVRQTLASSLGQDSLISERRQLLTGRSGRTRWRVTSHRSSSLRSSVVDLDHESVSRCVEVAVNSAGAFGSTITCGGDAAEPLQNLGTAFGEADTEDRCKPPFRLVHGVVDGPVKRVVVLLGDGRRVTARTAPVPSGPQVSYAIAVPASAAVRGVRIEPAGGPARMVTLAKAPLQVVCGDAAVRQTVDLTELTSLFTNPPLVSPVGPVVTVASAPPLRVADGPGETLCIALGDAPFTALGCRVVAPQIDEILGLLDSFSKPRAFALALPARVATVRISAKGAVARSIATISGDGYAGRYAGRVRFAVATIAGYEELERLQLLDETGKVLHSESSDAADGDELTQTVLSTRRLAGRPGEPSLWQTKTRLGGEISRCVAITDGPRPSPDGPCVERGSGVTALLATSCATDRLTVAVIAPAGARVVAGLTRGRARTLALREGAGLLTLPARSGLRSLSIVRRSGRMSTLRVNAPAGAKQCGWRAVLTT